MESLPKLLTLADLRVSIPDVVLEMATRKYICSKLTMFTACKDTCL